MKCLEDRFGKSSELIKNIDFYLQRLEKSGVLKVKVNEQIKQFSV
jgi:hypothetical protein